MARPDYQSTLGFELVTVTDADGFEDHLIRKTAPTTAVPP